MNSSPHKFDAIVIGSGLGGLASAALLSLKGKKVLVLEKHAIAGGYATSFKRKEFKFDVALHQLGGIQETTFKDILKECGIYDKLEFIKHEYLYEAIYPDFELKVKNGDIKDLKKHLMQLFPNNKWGIRLWFFFMQKIGSEMKIWSWAMSNKLFLPFVLLVSPLLIPLLMFAHRISIKSIMNLCVKNPHLQKIFMEMLVYYGDSTDVSALYFLVPSYEYYFDGGYYVKGGGQRISDALKEVIEKHNGKVQTVSQVNEIIIENDKAVGVKTRTAEYYADAIIANASPLAVYGKLLAHWEKSRTILKEMQKIKIGPSVSTLYLGLDTTIEKLNPRFKNSYIVYLNHNYHFTPEFPPNNICLAIHSNIDASATSSHKSNFNITYLDKYERWDSLTREEYLQKKKDEINRLLGILSVYFPDIQKHIEVAELGTPKTMERYTGNPKGAIYGFSQIVGQSGFDRFKNTSPLKQLYFASAWTIPGGGFEGALRAGLLVASKIE